MPEVSFPPSIQRAIDAQSWQRAENREQMCRDAYKQWLRPRLRWLVDHPRLMRLYLRHKAADHERKQEEARIKRREWMALSCEEREAEIAKRREPLDLLVGDGMISMIEDLYRPTFSFSAQPERTVRDRCPKCRERECPNAPTRTLPATPGLTGAWNATIQPGSAMATKTKARRT